MTIFHSAILGTIQGITEFLPISSSGHLVIIPWLFGWGKHALSFDVMLHLGSLLAILIYFYKDWVKLLKQGFPSLQHRSLGVTIKNKLLWYIIVATIPAAIFGKLFEHKAQTLFRGPLAVAGALGAFGIIIYIAEKLGKNNRTTQDLNLMDVILIGLAQSLAIIPGISRSAATMSLGLVLNLKREEAARFSFLLSAPIIFGAGLVKLKEIFVYGKSSLPVLAVGFGVCFIFAMVSIHYLLEFLKKGSFKIFVVYRLMVALIIGGVFYLRKA